MRHLQHARITTVTLSLIALATVIACYGCSGPVPASAPGLQKVTMGIQVSPAMTTVMVAKDAGLFEKHGLDVELKEFTAGKFALQAFLTSSIDFAVSGEVPVALAALQGNDLRVVAQVVEATTNEVRVVARRDASTSPAQYFSKAKRKLATSFGGGPEFFTYSFLRHYKINDAQVEILSQRPEDMAAALDSGSVDAIAIFDPFAFVAERRLGDKAVTFTDSSLYSELYVLNARPDYIERQPEVIDRVLRAIVDASDMIERDPASAKQIVQRYTKLEDDVVNGIWSNFVFRPALTSQLLQFWEAEAQWARATNKITPNSPAVNFRSLIEPRFLRAIKPEAVRLDAPVQVSSATP